jgi:hypothetical protein
VLRTHTCGELGELNVGKVVTLCGWVDSYRDHGGGLFVDLRDRYGLTQVVFNPPDTAPGVIDLSKTVRAEYVLKVTGVVAERPQGMANPKLSTGKIEVRVTALEILNKSLTPPVSPNANAQDLPGEDLRLKHRYLDLRRTGTAAGPHHARPHGEGNARLLRRAAVHRRRDPLPRPQHARRRPRLSGAEPRPSWASSTRCRSRRSSTSKF